MHCDYDDDYCMSIEEKWEQMEVDGNKKIFANSTK